VDLSPHMALLFVMKDWIEERLQILRSPNVIPFPFSAERVERLRKVKAEQAEEDEQIKELPKDTS
tara:strand:- start:190 stop:384 length:195 start_codon:yes stop_codon:yes gene_type:complete